MSGSWTPWSPGFPLAPPGHPYPSPQLPLLAEAPGLLYAGPAPEFVGFICAGPTGDNIPAAAAARKSLGPQECGHFLLPAELPELRARYVKPVKVFAMWPGFFVGIATESSTVLPGSVANVLVIAVNTAPAPHARRVYPGHFPAPRSETDKMAFSLLPYHWGFVELSFVAPQKPLKYFLQLQSSARSERVGKAVAVGVLSLGHVVHRPGYSQLTGNLSVASESHAANVEKLATSWLRLSKTWLASWPSEEIVSGGGQPNSKDAVTQRFRRYLTPDRIEDALKGPDKDPVAVWRRAFFGFTTFVLGRSPQSLSEERAATAAARPPSTP